MPTPHKPIRDKATHADQPRAASLPDPAAMLEPSRLVGEMCAEFGVEVLRLASRRLAAQAELMDQLARTTSLAEAMERQMSFLQRASADYAQSLNGALSRGQARIAAGTEATKVEGEGPPPAA